MTVNGLIQQIFTHAQLPIFSQSWGSGAGIENTLLPFSKRNWKTKVRIVRPFLGLKLFKEEEYLALSLYPCRS